MILIPDINSTTNISLQNAVEDLIKKKKGIFANDYEQITVELVICRLTSLDKLMYLGPGDAEICRKSCISVSSLDSVLYTLGNTSVLWITPNDLDRMIRESEEPYGSVFYFRYHCALTKTCTQSAIIQAMDGSTDCLEMSIPKRISPKLPKLFATIARIHFEDTDTEDLEDDYKVLIPSSSTRTIIFKHTKASDDWWHSIEDVMGPLLQFPILENLTIHIDDGTGFERACAILTMTLPKSLTFIELYNSSVGHGQTNTFVAATRRLDKFLDQTDTSYCFSVSCPRPHATIPKPSNPDFPVLSKEFQAHIDSTRRLFISQPFVRSLRINRDTSGTGEFVLFQDEEAEQRRSWLVIMVIAIANYRANSTSQIGRFIFDLLPCIVNYIRRREGPSSIPCILQTGCISVYTEEQSERILVRDENYPKPFASNDFPVLNYSKLVETKCFVKHAH